jgi:hypothetical protein
MSRELKKQMKGAKTKAQRQAAFSRAAKICSGKSPSARSRVTAAVKSYRARKTAQRATRAAARKTRRAAKKPKARSVKNTAKGGLTMNKLYSLIRKGALLAPAVASIMNPATSGQQKISDVIANYTGYSITDGTFNWARLAAGYAPYLGAILVTKGIPKLSSIIRGL